MPEADGCETVELALRKDQKAWLAEVSRRTGMTLEELLRTAVDLARVREAADEEDAPPGTEAEEVN